MIHFSRIVREALQLCFTLQPSLLFTCTQRHIAMATLEARTCEVDEVVDAHPFQRKVQLVLPNHRDGEEAKWKDALGDETPFYVRVEASPSALVQPDVVHRHVQNRSNQFAALQLEKNVDKDDVCALSTDGVLYVAVGERSYGKFGLVGRKSRLKKRKKYLVRVDLRGKKFLPGRRYRERVAQRLERGLGSGTFACASVGNDGRSQEVCFSPFSEVLQQKKYMEPKYQCTKMPTPDLTLWVKHWDHENLQLLHEWMGAAACQVSAPQVLFPKDWEQSQVGTLEWNGFLLPAHVKHCVQAATGAVDSGRYPWIGINIWGCTHAPISWGGAEHGHGLAGEHHTSIISLPGDNVIVFRAAGKHDLFGK